MFSEKFWIKMKKLILAILLFIKTFPVSAAGNVPVFTDYKDQSIYEETLNMCHKSHSLVRTIISKNNLDAFLVSSGQSFDLTFGSGDPLAKNQHLANQGYLSDYTFDKLQSPGFIRALSECYPQDKFMQSAFIYSMTTVDTIGKIPSIIAMIYTVKGTSAIWSKFSTKFPRAAKTITLTAILGGIIYVVIEVRATLKSRQLTDFEKERINRISAGLNQNINATSSLVIQLANEEIAVQEIAYSEAQTVEDKEKILQNIQKIKAALSRL